MPHCRVTACFNERGTAERTGSRSDAAAADLRRAIASVCLCWAVTETIFSSSAVSSSRLTRMETAAHSKGPDTAALHCLQRSDLRRHSQPGGQTAEAGSLIRHCCHLISLPAAAPLETAKRSAAYIALSMRLCTAGTDIRPARQTQRAPPPGIRDTAGPGQCFWCRICRQTPASGISPRKHCLLQFPHLHLVQTRNLPSRRKLRK